MRLLGVAAVLATVALSACGWLPEPTPAMAHQPAAVANRAPLTVCGVENAGQRGPWNEAGRACFWKAYLDHQPAEFVSTRPTTEGDPITTIYRVLPDGSVEVFIDSTQDKWGSGRWEHLSCRSLAHAENGTLSNDFGPDDTCVAIPLP